MGEATSIAGGDRRRIQARKERSDAFSDARKQVFLDHLAGCCSVKRAAEAAGVAVTTVNNHRRRDPAFAQAFTEALESGYVALEASLLEGAVQGSKGYEPGADAEDVPGPETVDVALAQFLMGVRSRGAGQRTGNTARPLQRATEKELTEAILKGLALRAARKRKPKGKRT